MSTPNNTQQLEQLAEATRPLIKPLGRAVRCEECQNRLTLGGICLVCEEAALEAGGWEGTFSSGMRRINHLPQD